MRRRQRAKLRFSMIAVMLITGLTGCPAPTPGERISQLNGKVTVCNQSGVIDLDLSNTQLSDGDFSYVNGFCSNTPKYRSIHTLNLSNTAVTDKFLDNMTLQGGTFVSKSGLEALILTGTNTTEAAIKKYQAVDPDCRIVR
ncbi:MAG: hypothetical protein NXI04_15075 [Planctomycetaceae bacterium]|nr:hypothetical protein [Planctomycetaceae bacterium]